MAHLPRASPARRSARATRITRPTADISRTTFATTVCEARRNEPQASTHPCAPHGAMKGHSRREPAPRLLVLDGGWCWWAGKVCIEMEHNMLLNGATEKDKPLSKKREMAASTSPPETHTRRNSGAICALNDMMHLRRARLQARGPQHSPVIVWWRKRPRRMRSGHRVHATSNP